MAGVGEAPGVKRRSRRAGAVLQCMGCCRGSAAVMATPSTALHCMIPSPGWAAPPAPMYVHEAAQLASGGTAPR